MDFGNPLMSIDLPLPNKRSGKVRDVYDAELADGQKATVLVTSDRLSAFDVVMPNGVPGKGVALTQISRFWFEKVRDELGDAVPDHVISFDAAALPGLTDTQRDEARGRVTIGRQARVVPIECVVRGYLAGSGWKEYQQSQSVCGVPVPAGLQEADKLPEPIFTPATKAEEGHDENISFERACEIAGTEVMTKLRDMSMQVYALGCTHAESCGLILADTKFEFGFTGKNDDPNELILIDEILTPDSSRYWPMDQYQPGRSQPSFDKQPVRDYLQELYDAGEWDKLDPGPVLPQAVIASTQQRYTDAYRMLTGRDMTL